MTRPKVIVACADLMTASRFQTSGADVDLVTTRSPDAAMAAIAEHQRLAVEAGSALVVVVDLATCAEVPARVRELYGTALVVLGFAPHVQVELLEAGRASCTRVLPRGSVVKRFAQVITEALQPGI